MISAIRSSVFRAARQTRAVSTIKPFYTAESTATKGGRVGTVKGTEGFFTEMATPKGPPLNGTGASATVQNPETLFASGYASCFLGAVHAAAGALKIAVPKDTTVTCKTHLGMIETNGNGFGLAVDISGNFPGLDKSKAREIMDKAHNEICPYSKATRGNIVVNINVV
ncbi:hypothetical protein HDU98_009482 [Podochytrium sp. JEL0797]|nr:hypothetical protein HDU98_009482 [Podochytrium sp. JEL0797]